MSKTHIHTSCIQQINQVHVMESIYSCFQVQNKKITTYLTCTKILLHKGIKLYINSKKDQSNETFKDSNQYFSN